MDRQMKAQSISIQVSERTKCNACCRFCISRITPEQARQEYSIIRDEKIPICGDKRLRVGLGFAKQVGATHAILTGKADPLQERTRDLCHIIEQCRNYLPLVDLHTNGYLFQKGKWKEDQLSALVDHGLTMITFSIAHYDVHVNEQLMGLRIDYPVLIREAVSLGLLVRCSVVLCKAGIRTDKELLTYIAAVGGNGAHMVVARELWIPPIFEASETEEDYEIWLWCKNNLIMANDVEMEVIYNKHSTGITKHEPLPWGTKIYGIYGFDDKDHAVNLTFAKCEEGSTGTVLKSIVHKPNGHGYRNWDNNAEVLY